MFDARNMEVEGIKLLKAELRLASVRLAEEWADNDRALAEVWRCLRPPVHEGRTPPYGAIIGNAGTAAKLTALDCKLTPMVDPAVLRGAADGRTAFLLLDGGPERLVTFPFY